MGLVDLLFQKDGKIYSYSEHTLNTKAKMLSVKEFAIQKAALMIAKTIAKSEFVVYESEKGKTSRKIDDNYYTLNIRPNPNEDATTFWTRAIVRMLTDPDGCLIVNVPSTGLFIADEFTLSESVMFAKTVSGIKIGNLALDRTYSMNDCVLLRMSDGKIINYLNSYYSEIGDMLSYAARDFKIKNSKKWRIGIPTNIDKIVDSVTGKQFKSQDIASMVAERLSNDDELVISIPDAIKIESISGGDPKTSQDFRDLMKLALESAAIAYDIPIDIFTGQKTDKSTSVRDFITFAIDWVFEIIEDEVNAKLITKKEYLSGTKVRIDKSRIQHVDFFDTADSELKLILSGYSHDDLRIAKGLEPLGETWSQERSITASNGKGGNGV